MADFMDKMKNIFGFSENDYDGYDYDEYPQEQTVERVEEVPVRTASKRRNDNVLSLNASNLIISVHEPLSYDESPKIVDDLRADKSVVLNFEQLDVDVKRKIFDFVSGALYAIDGKIQKVNKDIFVLAPRNVEIDGLKEELKNTGMFPW
ncbi:cell division protein SepF [Peptoniphilus equinus]|uniref:Cell division protein SepF n=1 Tax=Peptoniphilus equinus TaxID=3016343 RepID=A0ABY7QWR5_9FIRM|nr:cell division protein SepF [Peptoniphilus equinus]WBW50715.1 cell division protein SepF [Peptoniphilus equinus]